MPDPEPDPIAPSLYGVASYRGITCFGVRVSSVPEQDKNEARIESYFGHNWIGRGQPGDRGVTITVTGTHQGLTTLELASQHAVIRALCDGDSGAFIEPSGLAWAVCLLDHFGPIGPVTQRPGGMFEQRYRCRILVLMQ